MERAVMDSILIEVVAGVLESLAFAEVFAANRPLDFSHAEKVNSVAIEILAPFAGQLELHMRRAYLCEMAEALFTEPAAGIGREKIIDLLAELLNTMAGSFLSMVLAADVKFRLGVPREIDWRPAPPGDGAQWHFRVDDDAAASFCLCLSPDCYKTLRGL